MSPEEAAIHAVVAELEALAIPYMVTGSLASTHHGRPRTTQDIDFVIDPGEPQLRQLVSGLREAGFYVDPDVAREALKRRRQFNAIQPDTGVKIDLIVRKDRPHSIEELHRRARVELAGGTAVSLATAEDCILSKLEWSRKAGGSEKQLADVMGVLEVQGPRLDLGYIDRWARELDILDLWQRLRPPSE